MMEWRVRADLSADGELKFDGPMLDGSPVDLLMAAIAGCFVKSCHMVQEAKGKGSVKTAIKAEVTGRKADNLPNRVEAVRIGWQIADLSADDAARIAKDAKRICTVTNSMSCEFEVYPL